MFQISCHTEVSTALTLKILSILRGETSRFRKVIPPLLPGLPGAIFAKGSACPNTFLPGSAQNVECDVTSRKQSAEEFLPGATTTPSGHAKLCRFRPGKQPHIPAPRAKMVEHSLLLSPRNFIGLQDRDCRSVRLTVPAQK